MPAGLYLSYPDKYYVRPSPEAGHNSAFFGRSGLTFSAVIVQRVGPLP
jgi:hypothetical protein